MRNPPRAAEGRYDKRQLRKQDLGEIEGVSSAIPDTALRERIRKAMEVSFSAQNPRGPENQGGRDSPLRVLAMIVPVFVALVIFVLDPPTVFILIFTGPVLVLFLALIGSRTKEITQRRFVELSWLSAFFLDIMQGMTTLKLFGQSKAQTKTIARISEQFRDVTMSVLQITCLSALALEYLPRSAPPLSPLRLASVCCMPRWNSSPRFSCWCWLQSFTCLCAPLAPASMRG